MATRVTFCLALFAASVRAANITTSYFMPKLPFDNAHVAFVASVINASDDRVTLAAALVNSLPANATELEDRRNVTLTLASTLYESSTQNLLGEDPTATPLNRESAYSYKCVRTATDAAADCTVSHGRGIALQLCDAQQYDGSYPTRTHTVLWTYSFAETEKGVDTILRTVPGSASTSSTMPAWCPEGGADRSQFSDISVPESAMMGTFTAAADRFGAYEVVITAGMEKLPTVTTGSAGGAGTSSGGVSKTGSPGIAPMKTMAPGLAGLGVAVAMFL